MPVHIIAAVILSLLVSASTPHFNKAGRTQRDALSETKTIYIFCIIRAGFAHPSRTRAIDAVLNFPANRSVLFSPFFVVPANAIREEEIHFKHVDGFIIRACQKRPHPGIILVNARCVKIKHGARNETRPCVIDNAINQALKSHTCAVNVENFVLISSVRNGKPDIPLWNTRKRRTGVTLISQRYRGGDFLFFLCRVCMRRIRSDKQAIVDAVVPERYRHADIRGEFRQIVTGNSAVCAIVGYNKLIGYD